jgi:hypothetical protein
VGPKPDGKPARTERVTFTRPAAERIAKVVREIEAGDRDCGPLRFERGSAVDQYKLTVGTFTGSWETAQWKTVTYPVGTGVTTVEVYNHCNPVDASDDSSCSQVVVFGKASGKNSVVEIQLSNTCATCRSSIGGLDLKTLPNYSGAEIQLLGHDANECLRWYSVTDCSTSATE